VHKIFIKIMKENIEFREKTKSNVQCSNEIYIYQNVIPYFKNFLRNIPISTFNDDNWIPRIYFADYRVFEELGSEKETILALENLNYKGYKLGPRLDLDEDHLTLMIKHIASYHAVSYAIRITDKQELIKLASGLIPLSFLTPEGDELESYGILFKIALMRFFRVVEERKELHEDEEFMESIGKFKKLYNEKPLMLMESFLKNDDDYAVMLHGDYNRNNVLFRYDQVPVEIRMFDFQETRFASPVIDLAFFMYMNLPSALRPQIWDKLLKTYHETLMSSLTDILKCENDDERLTKYTFEKFLEYISKFMFYGVMIGIHFIPWMACSGEECQKLTTYFETDMKCEELKNLAQICGGKDVDDRIISIALHAFEKGYMKIFD
jgi:thiamine kinase-like enzyme